ncbi:hypothetical protein GALMADRAFT_141311 [Galerina marginata CBS 339.88]|uniref:ATPase AAA-type core domain-containing protein n=1 Tax=Galerina marginata (strain CBS 339.88) TaxID=685588 RepID=A0A067SVZ1_GALM3|nr:hypothetical protein GALMADRAFT_141311 [Galerina marginata CBS 339.88]
MDGMDGRGQVVVIGATIIEPTRWIQRSEGQEGFYREFYFGLPGLEAGEKILIIMIKKWESWGGGESEDKNEEKECEVKGRINGLEKLTKGYGGADLWAALNAIQRRYLQPETIGVGLRDFGISIKKLVPSSARSIFSAATPLPVQFVPLLESMQEKAKEDIQRVKPVEKKLSALEAEFEDEPCKPFACIPRIIIHGPIGMGQEYICAAALHHLEGYHVQSLELGTLISDSTGTVEAAIIQPFVEAKRIQPSVIYVPYPVGWCAAVSETLRSTAWAMLNTIAPIDPILLLVVVDNRIADVRDRFGPTKDNHVEITTPSYSQRDAFFKGLMKDIQKPSVSEAHAQPFVKPSAVRTGYRLSPFAGQNQSGAGDRTLIVGMERKEF